MTPGERVIAAARTKLGCVESPPGSNSGPCVRDIQSATGAFGLAWCGSFVAWSYKRAGVDDDGIASASTWQIVENARRKGRLRDEPVPGCIVVWNPGPRGHTELFIRSGGLTIGGNTGDAVREHFRSLAGAWFAVPSALDALPEPVYRTVWWWEDVDAEPVGHGLYAREAYRERAVDLWVAEHGNPGHVRRGKLSVRRDGVLVPRWTFWTGERARSADFATQDARDADLVRAEARHPTHRFRTRSRRERVS